MTQWQRMLKTITQEFASSPNNFLQQSMIARTTHPRNANLAKKYYDFIKETNTVKKYRWDEPRFGSPSIAVENMSLSTIQSLYHIHNISSVMDIMECDSVVEIGGGYGNLCSLMKHAGYSGQWTIVDFPEMHTIQRKYIEAVTSTENVNFIDLKSLDNTKANLLVATFSMNEMPLSDRTIIEKSIDNFDSFYIQYNMNFDGVNNAKYFSSFIKDNSGKYEISHRDCKIYPNHPIIMATKK